MSISIAIALLLFGQLPCFETYNESGETDKTDFSRKLFVANPKSTLSSSKRTSTRIQQENVRHRRESFVYLPTPSTSLLLAARKAE